MNTLTRSISIVSITLGLGACKTTSETNAMTVTECEHSHVCTLQGLLEMSNDGHAYIGKMNVDGGGCVNVSLSEKQSKRMTGRPPQRKTITGRVLPYPHDLGFIEYRVNGRQIGYGKCGDYYIFVK